MGLKEDVLRQAAAAEAARLDEAQRLEVLRQAEEDAKAALLLARRREEETHRDSELQVQIDALEAQAAELQAMLTEFESSGAKDQQSRADFAEARGKVDEAYQDPDVKKFLDNPSRKEFKHINAEHEDVQAQDNEGRDMLWKRKRSLTARKQVRARYPDLVISGKKKDFEADLSTVRDRLNAEMQTIDRQIQELREQTTAGKAQEAQRQEFRERIKQRHAVVAGRFRGNFEKNLKDRYSSSSQITVGYQDLRDAESLLGQIFANAWPPI